MAAPPKVVARDGRLVRIEGVPGWFVGRDLSRPCPCGNRVFAVLEKSEDGRRLTRLVCERCVKPRKGEAVAGRVLLGETRT